MEREGKKRGRDRERAPAVQWAVNHQAFWVVQVNTRLRAVIAL